MNKTKLPDWLHGLPPSLEKHLVQFTPHRDGFVRKWEGETVFVLGKGRFLSTVDGKGWKAAVAVVNDAWEKKRQAAMERREDGRAALRSTTGWTLAQLTTAFLKHLDDRLAFGMPKPLSQTTHWDYQRTVEQMMAEVGPEVLTSSLGPAHFTNYARAIARESPAARNRKIAYLHYFMGWALRSEHFANNTTVRTMSVGVPVVRAIMGPELGKSSIGQVRDARMAKNKSFTPEEIARLWDVADERDRLWIGLGLNGAFDNGDIGGLTRGVIVSEAGFLKRKPRKNDRLVIDFRRRKIGKVRRVIPLVPRVQQMLRDYIAKHRPDAKDDEPIFLQHDGTRLLKFTDSGPQNYVTRRFVKLMVRAGLRDKPVITRVAGKKKQHSEGSGDGRGFRSLRTTFANLAPAGMKDDVEIVMGHVNGTVLTESYLEDVGLTRLVDLVSAVWRSAFSQHADPALRAGKPAVKHSPAGTA